MTLVFHFQRLDSYVVAMQFAKLAHEARIGDAELRDQVTRAAKSVFLNTSEGLPDRRTGVCWAGSSGPSSGPRWPSPSGGGHRFFDGDGDRDGDGEGEGDDRRSPITRPRFSPAPAPAPAPAPSQYAPARIDSTSCIRSKSSWRPPPRPWRPPPGTWSPLAFRLPRRWRHSCHGRWRVPCLGLARKPRWTSSVSNQISCSSSFASQAIRRPTTTACARRSAGRRSPTPFPPFSTPISSRSSWTTGAPSAAWSWWRCSAKSATRNFRHGPSISPT